ncbi:hypothetical protein [Actinomadura parmotrematis]|uniref:Uncharacterized protein n=1 Tax=Actinomadura parmotrematis TaxID=2864039 RepID=A0ABS7FLE5_9ACTN|nr:hypothetical protein [Actinomadura parmotrematis]MBW8481174.1 hypothetical protein [Actinomadura parmotrematis]
MPAPRPAPTDASARAGFSPARWDAARRRTVARAFREVPFYREQWAAAGRELDDVVPVPAALLTDQAFRLCPLGRPYGPAREPSLWTGGAAALRAALRTAGVPARGVPVLEVRDAMLDRGRLGRTGPAYGVLLSPGADVLDEERRALLDARAVRLAARAGRAVVVDVPATLEASAAALADAAGPGVRVRALPRADVATALALDGPVLLHDLVVGYYGARAPGCGRLHVLWRHHHARAAGGRLEITDLRRRRPTLCGVVPGGADGTAVPVCPEHGVPVIAAAG